MHDVDNLFSVKGKVVVVIGAYGKLGAVVTEAFFAGGAIVVACGRDESKLSTLRSSSSPGCGEVLTIKVDINDAESVTSLAQTLIDLFGNIDVIVNTTSLRPTNKLSETSTTSWTQAVLANSLSVYHTCTILGKPMLKRGSGSIIQFGSIYGTVAPDFNLYDGLNFETEPDYCFVKAGTEGAVRFFASKYGRFGVRVNSIVFGGFEGLQPQIFKTRYRKKTLLGRMLSKRDIQGAVVYLASDASEYVTGTSLIVDGGLTAI